jgi:hypothetical protein
MRQVRGGVGYSVTGDSPIGKGHMVDGYETNYYKKNGFMCQVGSSSSFAFLIFLALFLSLKSPADLSMMPR